MELGATVCTPRAPACPVCPLNRLCRARARGLQGSIPPPRRRPARRPVRLEVAGTDKDTIERFGRIVQYGKLYGPYNCIHRDGIVRKDMWHWIVSRDGEARRVAARLLPYLMKRRSARIKGLLAR